MKICKANPEKVILSAIKKYVEFIAPTYGPAGKKTLIVHSEFNVEAVDDGKRSIQAFELEDELEDAVIRYVKETTEKGKDGTTTAGLIMGSIVTNAYENLDDMLATKDYHGMVLGLKKGVEEAVKAINKASKAIKTKEELFAIAHNSFNDDKIAKIIAETVHKIGKDGVLSVEDSRGTETTVEVVNGLEIPKGYASPYLVTEPEKAVLDNPAILVVNRKINLFSELLPVITKPSQRPGARDFAFPNLVVVAEGFGDDVVNKCIAYKMTGGFNPLLIEAPGFGDRLENMTDLATVVGATVVDDKTLKLADAANALGSCESVKSTKDKTIFLGGAGKTKEPVATLKALLETSTNNFEKEKLTKRIAALTGGVAVIKVGAYTENEQKGIKAKVENAVNSAQIAFRGGVVSGAGKTLADIKTSSDLLNRALRAPREQLEANGAMYLDEGTVDPTEVVITALQAGVSIASGLLEMGGISVPKRKKEKEDINF